jgi:hypothetical protein
MSASAATYATLSMLVSLAEHADSSSALHGAAFACMSVLLDAAAEDGIKLDTDALGLMAGSFE